MSNEMTIPQACAARIREFTCTRGCSICGCRERYFTNWSPASVFCAQCYPDGTLSAGKSKSAVNAENKEKQKKIKDNWQMPRVFGGYSTAHR